jgi:hypothetical protein
MARHTFTRQELFELVWSEPMTKLAARYGISGNGLAKACRKADVPVPERGYWNRLHAGQKVEKTSLPNTGPNTPDRVIIDPPLPRPEAPPPPPVPPTVQEKIEREGREATPIAVFATLSSPHRIIAAWLEQDRRERRERRHDPWFSSRQQPIDGSDLAKRRLRILSALFKALEKRGYRLVTDDSPYNRAVQIVANEEKFSIVLEERIRQVRRKLTDEDRADRSRYFSANQTWTQEKFASGELVLTISEQNSYGPKRRWSDMPDAPLESKLGEVLPEVAGMFEELRLRRIAEAEARERQRKAEQERYRKEMERKREMVRDRRLLRHCQDWHTANSIRAFIAAVEASPLPSAHPDEFAAWKHRALDYAGRLDPLQNAAILDLNVTDHETYSLRE